MASEIAAHPYSVAPAYTFSRSARYKGPSKSPGPFDYSPERSYYNPSYSISRSKRILSNYRNITPGPGYYNTINDHPRYRKSFSKLSLRTHLNKTPVTIR